jgi:GNAT superfamily N-acetyltransferase
MSPTGAEEVRFDPASTSSLGDLLALMREFYAVESLPFDEETAKGALVPLLSDDAIGRAWLMRLGGAKVGYAVLTLGWSLEFRGRTAFVDELYVREAYRRQGIGGKTVDFLETVAKGLGVQAVVLEVGRENAAARSLYEKRGFEDRGYLLVRKWVAR